MKGIPPEKIQFPMVFHFFTLELNLLKFLTFVKQNLPYHSRAKISPPFFDKIIRTVAKEPELNPAKAEIQ